jgi:hypothetical protein
MRLSAGARAIYWGALAQALTGGVRQSVLLLLLPLWFGCALGASARGAACAGGWVSGSVLAWLVPMAWLSGGPSTYGRSTQLCGSMLLPTSVLGGSLEITLAQMRYLLESTLVGLGPLGLVVLALPAYARRVGWRAPELFLLAWILPAGIFYTLVHFGQAGYVLTFLPALVILLVRARVGGAAGGRCAGPTGAGRSPPPRCCRCG